MNDRIRNYKPLSCSTPSGSGIRPKFVKKLEEGKAKLVKCGETDQQALINSYKDECDFNRIVERYQNGDVNALARVQGLYTDISGYPDNTTDCLNLPIQALNIIDEINSNNNVKNKDSSASPENVTETEEDVDNGNS